MSQKKQAKFLDFEIPFFLPVWRRVAVVVVPILWSLFEFSNGATAWGLIFLGLGGIAGWRLSVADWDAVRASLQQDDRS